MVNLISSSLHNAPSYATSLPSEFILLTVNIVLPVTLTTEEESSSAEHPVVGFEITNRAS